MDIRSLNTFIQVAELGSFSKAGERLGYSQPTVSVQIKQLEQELGVRLFDRISHTVVLTAAGHEVLDYAQRICRLSQEMLLGSSGTQEPQGIVRLGMADSLCATLISSQFGLFQKRYPKLSLSITTAGTKDLFQMLDQNEVDLVCTLDSHIYDTAYVIANEEKVGVHFVVSARNPLATAGPLTIEQLIPLPFLLTERGMSYRRLLDERLAQRSLELHPVLVMGSADLLSRLAEQDVGLSFLPDYVTEDAVQSGRLVRLEVKDFELELWKQLLYRRDKWVSPPIQAVIDHLSEIAL